VVYPETLHHFLAQLMSRLSFFDVVKPRLQQADSFDIMSRATRLIFFCLHPSDNRNHNRLSARVDVALQNRY
jgi:hypothetical protein